jgi:hypothetical protein
MRASCRMLPKPPDRSFVHAQVGFTRPERCSIPRARGDAAGRSAGERRSVGRWRRPTGGRSMWFTDDRCHANRSGSAVRRSATGFPGALSRPGCLLADYGEASVFTE